MGCDIHGYIERREIPGGWKHDPALHFPDDRSYDVFAVLAGVRNGYGFAGVNTGEGYNSIAEPRGLPNDVSPEVREASDDWGCNGHTHSWLTLGEVFRYDYLQETTKTGALSLPEWLRLEDRRRSFDARFEREYPAPDSWCGSISGGGVVTVPEVEARRIAAALKEPLVTRRGEHVYPSRDFTEDTPLLNGQRVYVQATWRRRYLDAMSHFLTELVPLVRYGLDDVRLVFWFDN